MKENLYKDLFNQEYRINTGKGILSFKEASFLECIEIIENMKQDKNYIVTFLKEFVEKYGEEGMVFTELDPVILWKNIQDYYFKGFFIESEKNTQLNSPFYSIVDFVAERYSQNPFEFLSKITYSQFNYLLKGAEWNINEMSEKGKEKNQVWKNQQIDKEDMQNFSNRMDDIVKKIQEGSIETQVITKN